MSFFKKVLSLVAESSKMHDNNVYTPVNDWVSIEYLTESGTWFGVGNSINDSFLIASALQQAKRQYPDNRVRAVTRDGRLVDMMM